MDHFVHLDGLPDNLEFPGELNEKINYDSERRGLVYRGPMSKREYDMLCPLHADSDYRRAIEELFRVATWDAEEKGQKNGSFTKLLVLGITTLIIVALLILCVVCTR